MHNCLHCCDSRAVSGVFWHRQYRHHLPRAAQQCAQLSDMTFCRHFKDNDMSRAHPCNAQARISRSQVDFLHSHAKLDMRSQIYSGIMAPLSLKYCMCTSNFVLCTCESLCALSLEFSYLLDLMLTISYQPSDFHD